MSGPRKRKPHVTWVTMGPEPHLATCRRCGRHEPKPDLPTPLTAFVGYLRYVEEKHRFCPEPSPDV